MNETIPTPIGQVCQTCGNGKGVLHLVASALSLDIAEMATVLSHKCDIPLVVEGQPNCKRELLTMIVSAGACGDCVSSYSHPTHHVHVVTPCNLVGTECVFGNAERTFVGTCSEKD